MIFSLDIKKSETLLTPIDEFTTIITKGYLS